jgi:hypothetical protein
VSLQDALMAEREGRPERPRRRAPRLDLVVAWCVLAGPALALVVWGAARQRVGDLEERLVRDAAAVWSVPHPRPVHVDTPVPGTIGEAIAAHLPALDAEALAVQKDDAGNEALRAVLAGDAPVSALPARHVAALARLAPALDGVLAGSRAERADFAEATDPFAGDEGAAGFLGLQHAARLAGARSRLALAAGEPDAALRDCLDALGLGRDAAIWGGLVGHMVGAAVVSRVAPACAAALEALPPARLPDAARRVRAIRDTLPPFSATLRAEAVAMQLLAGENLAGGVRERLPVRARGLVGQGVKDPPWYQSLVVRDAWRFARAALDRAVAAADLSEPERERAFQEVVADLDRRVNFAPAIALPLPAYGRYGRRADDARRRLDALAVAATARAFRAARGRWPASVAELEGGNVPGAVEIRLSAAAPAAPLLLHVALRSDPEKPERFTLALRPPRGGAGSPPARSRAE